jgi:hypothetical protein
MQTHSEQTLPSAHISLKLLFVCRSEESMPRQRLFRKRPPQTINPTTNHRTTSVPSFTPEENSSQDSRHSKRPEHSGKREQPVFMLAMAARRYMQRLTTDDIHFAVDEI